MDYFDQIPDPLILQIFNSVADVRTLAGCRAVSRRFGSLVPQSESLVLRVDRVVSESDLDSLLLLSFLKTLFKSLISTLLSPKAPFALPDGEGAPVCPARILSGFDRIRELDIELPAGDLRLEKGTVVRYKAAFGASLKSCVILGFGGESGGGGGGGFAEGLRERVLWVISVLIAASARHSYVEREVVGQHTYLARLVVRDRDGEGEVVMDASGLAECREEAAATAESGPGGGRAAMPSVMMKMRHLKTVEVGPGVCLEGATLVVVRPSGPHGSCGLEDVEDAEWATEAFGGGVYANAVQALLNSRSYVLEMNSH